jgi:hypothetical protein
VDLQEAAGLLGVSTEAVRKRATRGSLRSEKREDGRVVVWVDDDRTEGGRESQGETFADGGALVEVLREQAEYLREQLDQERAARTEERRRHDTIIAQLTQANAALAQRVPELEAPREQSRATEEPEAPETVEEGSGEVPPRPGAPGPQEAAQPRSWWRRWFGP